MNRPKHRPKHRKSLAAIGALAAFVSAAAAQPAPPGNKSDVTLGPTPRHCRLGLHLVAHAAGAAHQVRHHRAHRQGMQIDIMQQMSRTLSRQSFVPQAKVPRRRLR
jgi:hypothetical protein